jgi:hypothetical protein
MFTYEIEVLDETKYYATTNERGTTTIMFNMRGTTFVQVNRSAPKALADIKKPSNDVKNLIMVFEA